MKKLFTSVSLLLWAGVAFAQTPVTFTQSSYSNLSVSSDTFGRITSSPPALPLGAGVDYDFSGVVYDNTTFYSEQSGGTHPSFPNASSWGPRRYTLGSHKLIFDSKRWSGVTAAGLERIGESIDRQAVHLSGIQNATSTDSLVIPQQNVTYSSPYPLIKFPATLGSTWTAKFDLVVNMELTYAHMGYNQAPMQYKVTTEYEFTCPGYGTAYVLRKNDLELGKDQVLHVRIKGKTVDSFLVNGTPGDPQLLTALGLLQNQTSNNHWDELFRDNEINALVLYYYGSDNTFSSPMQVDIHQLRIPFTSTVKSVSTDGGMMLYPNPAQAGSQLFVKLAHPAKGNYSYTLSTISGAVASKGTIAGKGQGSLEINLPQETMKAGIYWLSLYSNGALVGTAPVQVNK